MATETQVAFRGTEAQQELAHAAWDVMKRKGVLFGANAPIKMNLAGIIAALTKAGGAMQGKASGTLSADLEAALLLNADVFAREAGGDFVTTKSGHAPGGRSGDVTHTFKERLNSGATSLNPEAAAQYRASLVDLSATRDEKTFAGEDMDEAAPIVPAQRMAPYAHPPMPERRTLAVNIIPADEITPELRSIFEPEVIEEPEIEITEPEVVDAQHTEAEVTAVTAQAPAAPTMPTDATPAVPVPATPETPATGRMAEPETSVPTPHAPQTPIATTTPIVGETAAPVQPTVTEQPRIAPIQPPVVQPNVQATPAQATPAQTTKPTPVQPVVEAPVAPVRRPVAPVTPQAPAAPVFTGPVEVVINGITVDLRDTLDEILIDDTVENALVQMVEGLVANDARLLRFGSDFFPEEATERFSKGDYRRIKEYLDEPETGGLASDRDIMADVLNRRTDFPDYERIRFSLNARMLKEKKDFEFVGIDSDRLWVSAGTSPATPPTRKPAEVGQDYRFLEDAAVAAAEGEALQAPGPLPYTLTNYEYEQGVLPYDARFKQIFPGALFEDQRAALIRFEVPQLYGALVAELRYPTGNRGGFIMGLKDLFGEHMVPGARFTVVPTDRGQDVFEITFNRAEELEANLMQFDDRRSRYVFRPVSYAIETDPAMLLTQEKFGKLHNHKKLEESERKRPDLIIVNAFEAIGEENDGKLWAAIDDLYAVTNIERPMSRSWLHTLLTGAYPFFHADPALEGAYFYDASLR